MKTDASLWPQMLSPKGTPQTLTVVSGKTSMLDTGKIMETIVQRHQNNVFKIILRGETFIVKGLPASMQGREISVMAQRYGAKLELVWQAGPAANQLAGGKNEAENVKNSFHEPGEKITISSRGLGKRMQGGSHASGTVKLQIIAGNTHGLSPGRSHSITARKADNGSFNITVKGQAFTIRGLPEAMAGKTITITTRQSTAPGAAKITFEWVKDGGQQLTGGNLESGTRMAEKTTHSLPHAPTVEKGKTQEMPILQSGTQSRTQSGVQSVFQSIRHRAQTAMPHLKSGAGEITMALVQKRLPNGNIRLNIAGATFESPAPPSVKQGDALMLRMSRGGELEVMQVQKNMSQKALNVIKNHLPASSPAAQSIAAMRSLLPTVAAGEVAGIDALTQMETWLNAAGSSKEEPINGQRLAALIRDSGVNLESKLMTILQHGKLDLPLQQDLKAILLQIAELQPDKARNAALTRTLIELAGQGISRIEAGQALNMLANIQNEPYRIEFPMLINQQVANVQLSFQQNSQSEQHESGGGESSDQSYNVLFALELSQLGKLRVDANISGHSVYARIYNGSDEMQQFIQQHIHRLGTRLHDLGYKEVHLRVSATRPDSEKQARFEQLTAMRPATFNLLDVRV